MSLPAPLAHAFPHLVAEIDADRPLIAAALVDVQVIKITDQIIYCNVLTQHSFDILTTSSQSGYLDNVAAKHLKHPNAVFMFYNDRPTTAEEDMGELPLPASEHVVHGSLRGSAAACPASAPPATTNGSPQRNALKFNDRTRLSDWMKLPENKEYVARQTDTDAAVKATSDLNQDPTQPLLNITTANITGMRNTLGISKFKPEKPAETPTVDLIALQKQLDAYGQQVQRQAIAANTIHDVLNLLIAHVRQCEAILKLLARGEVGTELSMAGLNDLPPLCPFPAGIPAPEPLQS